MTHTPDVLWLGPHLKAQLSNIVCGPGPPLILVRKVNEESKWGHFIGSEGVCRVQLVIGPCPPSDLGGPPVRWYKAQWLSHRMLDYSHLNIVYLLPSNSLVHILQWHLSSEALILVLLGCRLAVLLAIAGTVVAVLLRT